MLGPENKKEVHTQKFDYLLVARVVCANVFNTFIFNYRPLSMSENLTKLAHKIDFSKDESEEKGKPTSEGEKEDDDTKAVTPFQPSLWPWDSVRNKLK